MTYQNIKVFTAKLISKNNISIELGEVVLGIGVIQYLCELDAGLKNQVNQYEEFLIEILKMPKGIVDSDPSFLFKQTFFVMCIDCELGNDDSIIEFSDIRFDNEGFQTDFDDDYIVYKNIKMLVPACVDHATPKIKIMKVSLP